MRTQQQNINLLFLLLLTAYTGYTIFFQQAGFFFVVYIFWFDELIRNISLLIQLRTARRFPANDPLLINKNRSVVLSRFFFLFVYAVFIVVVFGIFYHLAQDKQDELIRNIRILVFMDPVFNVSLGIAIVREFMIIRTGFNRGQIPYVGNAMNGHLVTMHLSILLGGVMFFLTTKTAFGRGLETGALKPYILILPFLIIKFVVDCYNSYGKGNTTAISAVQ